jgi:hypothetical protein
MHRMSDSIAICSEMIVVMFCDVWEVPMPLRFWNMIRRVFGGFSCGRVLPIHELGGCKVRFCCVVELSIMSLLFSVLLEKGSESFVF